MVNQPTHRPAPIPHGVADYFWQEAQQRRTMTTRALDLFALWGYQEVIPPAFEYATTLDGRGGAELQGELYRFVDRDGSSLALRADMTIPVARLVATRLHDVPMPQRFCYAGTVYRSGAGQAGLQREFWQAGVELIGAAEAAADAEVLAMTVRALGALGIDDVRPAVGHHGFFDGLIAELKLTDDARHALLDAVDRNSDAALSEFLRQSTLDEAARATLAQLPHLSGSDTTLILERARRLCLNEGMRAAVANLAAILDAYGRYGLGRPLYLDLTEIHHLGYYTGLAFEALTPWLGFPLASGGRYDHLVGSFGAPQPAVGAAILLDRVALALRRVDPEQAVARPLPPALLAGGAIGARLLGVVETLRTMGLRVQLAFGAHPDAAALRRAAEAIGAPAALHAGADGGLTLVEGGRARPLDEEGVEEWAAGRNGRAPGRAALLHEAALFARTPTGSDAP